MAEVIEKGPILGQRHLQVLLLFLAMMIAAIHLSNAAVMVVAMTNAETTNPNYPEYDWTEMEKSLIVSTAFWGYLATQFPAGYLCHRFGAKAIMLVSVLGSSVLTAAIPISVEYGGWQAYCAIRVLLGIFLGLLQPCVYASLAAWCPVNERNSLGALATMGNDWGIVYSMLATGMITTSAIGWPGASYVAAILGGVWCICWIFLSANNPIDSKWISLEEKSYIEDSKNKLKEKKDSKRKKSIPIPWRAIFTSGPFLALILTRSCELWGFFTLQAEMPAYMNGLLGMDMKQNALYSALPFFVMMCMSYVYVILSEILLRNNMCSLSVLRKTFNSLAFWLPATGLIILGFLKKEQKTWAIVLLTACVGINAGNIIGSGINAIDLSLNHVSILTGIINGFSSIMLIIIPLFAGAIVKDQTNRTQWQIVFFTAALFFGVGNLVYVIFGSTSLQPWDAEDFLVKENVKDEENCKQQQTF